MLKKNLVSTPILAHLAQIRVPSFFFFENLVLSVTRYHGRSATTMTKSCQNLVTDV